jgi:hypothetical protein
MSSDVMLTIKGVAESRGDATAHLRLPGDALLIERGRPRWLLLACPCGCGDEIPINLDARAGKAWRLYRHDRFGVSLYPSVWRDTDCGSHFIIWRNRIYLFGRGYGDYYSSGDLGDQAAIVDAVHARLPTSSSVSFADIAESLGEVPWDVLDVCRHLARAGRAQEGTGKQRGMFRRV